ncbi:MAG: DUF427 domain-containing protein [Gemmatimonadaceae bacterium]
MARATWNGVVLAESDKYETVEGNVYFPPAAVRREHLAPSTTTTHCPWKGEAHYYTVRANGETNADAAWYYPNPNTAAANIKDHVAFWRGVTVER